MEVCDPDHRDEDCNPLTVGLRDEDDDGYIDARCCNRLATGELHCGDDCDDSRPNVHRSASEVCDGIDNDCDGAIDEGVSYLLWPDADRDSFGDASAEPEHHCSFLPGYALIGGDCDDEDHAINPGTHDVCNGVDDDCDANIDEGAEALCNRPEGIAEAACIHLEGEAAPRCVITACDAQRLDCDLDPASGCEANYCDELAHCGACGGYGGACSFGYCRDGRCAPDALRVNELAGRVVRDRDGSPLAGAIVRRLRDCTPSGNSAVASASGEFALQWEFRPPFQHFKTEAAGYATQIDPEATADDIRLLETAELDALLAMSPVPVDRRLGVVVVDSGDGAFEIVEPIFGTYRAPAIPGHSFEVPLPDGRVRQIFVNVRPGTARVRVNGAGDARRVALCNVHGPDWPGDWDAPGYHDVVVSQEGIVHLRFGWCTILAVGG